MGALRHSTFDPGVSTPVPMPVSRFWTRSILEDVGDYIARGQAEMVSDVAYRVKHLDRKGNSAGLHAYYLLSDTVTAIVIDAVSIDYVFDQGEMDAFFRKNQETFPAPLGYAAGVQMLPPEHIPALVEELLARGFSKADVSAVVGGNWMRIARQVWRA